MTPNRLLGTACFLAALLTSSSLFAQVKVGTNPTTIESASNLEVEASTTGRKVKVNKTTGQLTIADGTQGAGKVLGSDANGGASWQLPLVGSLVNANTLGTTQTITETVNQVRVYSGGNITFPEAGTYIIYGTYWIPFGSTTSYTDARHCFINLGFSSSATTYTQVGLSSQWRYVPAQANANSIPSVKITVTKGQTLYAWFFTGYFQGNIYLTDLYAVGPF